MSAPELDAFLAAFKTLPAPPRDAVVALVVNHNDEFATVTGPRLTSPRRLVGFLAWALFHAAERVPEDGCNCGFPHADVNAMTALVQAFIDAGVPLGRIAGLALSAAATLALKAEVVVGGRDADEVVREFAAHAMRVAEGAARAGRRAGDVPG